MKKNILLTLAILIVMAAGWSLLIRNDFDRLGPGEKHERIIKQRDVAIAEARERGDYRCCIEPACTMCYMEGNKWNYGEAGACGCDDFIAKGEEPCPQCIRGIEDGQGCSSSAADKDNTSCSLGGIN